jgi:hypothetical protein
LAVAKAKYLLQEEWHLWRDAIPADHDHRTHHCVDDAYFAAYKRLHMMALTLTPLERLLLDYYADRKDVPPPPPAPVVTIPGFPLGEAE